MLGSGGARTLGVIALVLQRHGDGAADDAARDGDGGLVGLLARRGHLVHLPHVLARRLDALPRVRRQTYHISN